MYVAAAVIANLVKQRQAQEEELERLARQKRERQPVVIDVGAILAAEREAVVKLCAERCRLEAYGVPRPALSKRGQDFIVVGREEGIMYGHTDGVIYEVKLAIGTDNRLAWQRIEPKPLQVAAIEQFTRAAGGLLLFRAW